MKDAPTCPSTGAAMIRAVRPMTLTYRGRSVTVDMPGWYSEADSLHTGEDMKVSDRAIVDLKAVRSDLLSPDDIRRIRTSLGLTQRQAGEVLGGGPNAFARYESGHALPSRAISNLLQVLERHPEEIARLGERRSTVRRRPRREQAA